MKATTGQWYRKTPFKADYVKEYTEIWEYISNSHVQSFEVDIQIGKPLDVIALKGTSLQDTLEYSDFLKSTAKKLYIDNEDFKDVKECIMCGASTQNADIVLNVFNVDYMRCTQCGHVSINRQPSQKTLLKLFEDSETHSSLYIDDRTIQARMDQVIFPKLTWVKKQFSKHYSQEINTLADIGAGGGHFVAFSCQNDINAIGFEKSKSSRMFAQKAFDLQLREDDFLESQTNEFDVITMWGLLEYVPEPREFIKAARRKISDNGMLVIEIPRVDGLGTQVQAMDNAVIARHMDPTSHVNGFSDQSICDALLMEGFAPVAAWYFGMDAFELITQMAFHLDNENSFDELLTFLSAIQAACDQGRQCDDLIIAAIPLKS